MELLNAQKIVAIVGSRNCSEYGRKYANIFASELAKRGICVISGMAIGIDTSAHCGAMHEVGKTIAVLGGGFKYIYPSQNIWLYNNIIDVGGCIITEYEENEETKMSNFPKRNRLISGLADAVLVIEAEHRSGSKITATYAKIQKKKVYCIPVSLDQKNSSGINELLTDGAKIVTTPRQLIEDLYGKNFYKNTCGQKEKKAEENKENKENNLEENNLKENNPKENNLKENNLKEDNLKENSLKENNLKENNPKENNPKKNKVILGNDNSVVTDFSNIFRLLEQEMTSEEIAKKINRDISEVNSMLTIMEIEGTIEQTPGNYYVRACKKIS